MRATSHHPGGSAISVSDDESNRRIPYFQARDHSRFLELEVLLPGVSPPAVQVTVEARDLVVTARQPRPVRTNWQAAHFEAVQPDYELRFHLGQEFDTRRIRTKMQGGILKVRLPKARRQWPAARPRKGR